VADTDLATAPEQQIATRWNKMVSDSTNVVSVADRTYELPRDEYGYLVRPMGPDGKSTMSDAMWNLHCDAMKSNRNVPVYLAEHYKRVETSQKIAGARGGDLPPVAGYVLHVWEKKQYPVVDVTVNEEK
jgi:hypothetical protein